MATPTDKTARKLKYGTNVIVATILFLVVLGVINYFAQKSQGRMRLDLTRDKQYTISPATKTLLGSLKDLVTVTVYATEQNTPPDWTEQRNQLRNLLYEYRLSSKDNVRYEFKDPTADPTLARQAEQDGIREQAMQQASATELSVKAGYLGFVVQYRGRKEVVAIIRPESSVEYQLTRAINKVAQVNIPTVGIIAPGGNPFMGEQGNYAAVPQFLQQEGYTVKNLEPGKLNDLKDVNLLMVFQPEELSEEALYRIDQYVIGGGKLFVAASGVQIDQRSGRAQPKAPPIDSLLQSYGLRIGQDVVEDWGRGLQQNFMTMRGLVASRNPFIIEVTDLNQDSIITRKLPRLVFIYSSSVSKSEHGTSGTIEVLAQTSNRSKKQEQTFELDQQKVKPPPRGDKLDSFNLVMSVSGPLESRYAVADPPVITEDNGTTRTVAASEVKLNSPPEARVVVAGSSFAFINDVIARGDGQINALFLLNVADALTRGGEMISLRSKRAENAVLKSGYTEVQARAAQIIVIASVPVLLIIFGIIKFQFNRMKRSRYRDIYGS